MCCHATPAKKATQNWSQELNGSKQDSLELKLCWFDIYSIKTSTSFYRKPRNRNENAVSRKFKFKYLNCRDLFQHNLSLGPGPPLRLCRPPRCRRHRLWRFRPPQPGRSLYQLPGSPGQEKIEEFNIVIHLSLGPLLNSLHEDFLTEPISVLCNLNDINRDAKTNKHPFQFFNEKQALRRGLWSCSVYKVYQP